MLERRLAIGIGVVCAGAALIGLWSLYSVSPARQHTANARVSADPASLTSEPIAPLPLTHTVDPKIAALGNRLFHDPRLSHDNTLACATCHILSQGGADGLQHSVGIGGVTLGINTPTVFNSGFNFRQFWDGRALSLEDQIDGPLEHSEEMGSTWTAVIEKLRSDGAYKTAFREVYPDGIQIRNVKDAIAMYERTLTTPDSRFDRYLRGDATALSAPELRGYRLFKNYGCVACHQGINIGGNMFQKFGVMGDYFKDRGKITPADLGRYNITKKDEDRHVFKVPGLRNVAVTAPYFHDGSAATLDRAVALMGKYQLGVDIPAGDVALIVAFLGTLTAPLPEKAQ